MFDIYAANRESIASYSQQCEAIITNPKDLTDVTTLKCIYSDKSLSYNPDNGAPTFARNAHISIHSSLIPEGKSFMNFNVLIDGKNYLMKTQIPNKTTGLILFLLTDL